jgi:hypothetical protein
MNAIIREIKEKIDALTSVILSGQLTDYAAYREALGRLASMRELLAWHEERKDLDNGDDIDD